MTIPTVAIDSQIANIRQIVRDCPPVTLRRAYMRMLREWCQQTQWLRETVTASTVANTPSYTLTVDSGFDVMGVRALMLTDQAGNVRQLPAADPTDVMQWNPNEVPDLPRRYAYLPEGSFELYPTPSAVYAMSLVVIVAPQETSATPPSTPLIKYSNDIEAGALSYLLSIPGQPWTDKRSASEYARQFQAGVAMGKAEAQRGYNTGPVIARGRPFVTGGFVR